MKKFLPGILIYLSILVFSFLTLTYASIDVKIIHTDVVRIDEEFEVSYSGGGFVTGDYYIKGRIGKDTSSMNKGLTYKDGNWLSDTEAWINFPVISADNLGSISGTIKLKAKPDAGLGLNNLVIRFRKVGETDNFGDSQIGNIELREALPTLTPTSVPTEIPTPTKTPSPTKTPTLTKTPTPQNTSIPINSPTTQPTTKPTTVSSTSVKIPTVKPTPKPEVLKKEKIATSSSKKISPTKAGTVKGAKTSSFKKDLPKILIVFGILSILAMIGTSFFLPKLNNKL